MGISPLRGIGKMYFLKNYSQLSLCPLRCSLAIQTSSSLSPFPRHPAEPLAVRSGSRDAAQPVLHQNDDPVANLPPLLLSGPINPRNAAGAGPGREFSQPSRRINGSPRELAEMIFQSRENLAAARVTSRNGARQR